jgi:hypothetical protein
VGTALLARLPGGPPPQTPNNCPQIVEWNSSRSNQRYLGSHAAAVAVARHRAGPQLSQPACREKVPPSREAEAAAPAPGPQGNQAGAGPGASAGRGDRALGIHEHRLAGIQGPTGVLGHTLHSGFAGDRDHPSAAVPRSTQPISGCSNRSARRESGPCGGHGHTGRPPGRPGRGTRHGWRPAEPHRGPGCARCRPPAGRPAATPQPRQRRHEVAEALRSPPATGRRQWAITPSG